MELKVFFYLFCFVCSKDRKKQQIFEWTRVCTTASAYDCGWCNFDLTVHLLPVQHWTHKLLLFISGSDLCNFQDSAHIIRNIFRSFYDLCEANDTIALQNVNFNARIKRKTTIENSRQMQFKALTPSKIISSQSQWKWFADCVIPK